LHEKEISSIVKHKNTKDLLRRNYHLLSMFFHNSPLHNFLFRFVRDENAEIVDWIFEDVNALGEKTVGKSASEIKGKSVSEVFGKEIIAPYIERLREVASTGESQQFVTHFPFDDRHYYVSIFLLSDDLCAVSSKDISEQVKAEEESQKAHEMFQQALEKAEMVSRQMESARENERKLIAHEIHDELGQMLVALQMDLHWIGMQVDEQEERIKVKLDGMISIVSNLLTEIQRITSHLSPRVLADLGIHDALEWLVSDFRKRSPIRYEFTSSNADYCSDSQCSTAVFRIAQAALTNVVRHSLATQVEITLTCGQDRALLEIKDNGIGISEDKITALDSMGLIGMRERARCCGGTLTISGNKGNGARIIASIPCSDKRDKFYYESSSR